ncbi:MAG: hypothetical protein FJW96_02400 [Actinobacteria bacterium]|nr:hypothetical protein [Actinomycetota bacterium]
MPTAQTRQARLRARRRRSHRRARQIAVLGFLAALAVVTLLLTAFGSGTPSIVGGPDDVVPVRAGLPGRPDLQPLASVGNLQLVMPVAAGAVTGVGFHGTSRGGLDLKPAGRQGNEGALARLWRRITGTGQDGPVWYQLGSRGSSVAAVGAAPGTDVYAPVDGTVVAIRDQVVGGDTIASRVDIRPNRAPSMMVSVSNISPDPVLTVGSTLVASSTKIGKAVDIAAVEKQALAKHARDGGNNVAVSVYPTDGALP